MYTAYIGNSSNTSSQNRSITIYYGSGSYYGNYYDDYNYNYNYSSYLTIDDIYTYYTNVGIDNYTEVRVTTSDEVTSVSIRDYNDNVMDTTSSYTTSGSKRIWTLSVRVRELGSNQYYVYAYGNNSNYNRESFWITGTNDGNSGSSGSSSYLYIDSVVPDQTSVVVNEYTNVRVTTGNGATSVRIRDRNDNSVASTANYTIDGSRRIWTLNVPVSEVGTNQFYAYSYNDNTGNNDRKSFTLTGISGSSTRPVINSISISDMTISEPQNIPIVIRTNSAVRSVYIYVVPADPLYTDVGTTSYSVNNAGEYVWELSFLADKTRVYGIYANGDDWVDTKSVSITVTNP